MTYAYNMIPRLNSGLFYSTFMLEIFNRLTYI